MTVRNTSRALVCLATIALLVLTLQRDSAARAADGGACRAPAYRALDFTLGTWSVSGADGKAAGLSRIRAALDGCAVVEDWSTGRHRGRNMEAYNAEDHRWHRFFVDTDGRVHVFEGSASAAQIRYEGVSTEPNGVRVLNRLAIRKDGANRFVQEWRKSQDAGETWKVAFRGLYTRTATQPTGGRR